MKTEKISIVMPTYNGAKQIRKSIDSCLNQTYENIELIIVDDGSTDETPQIIKSYKDERIRYFRHENNKGIPYALNTGFAHATGSYLTWTSDDNFYTEDAIERMLSFLKEKNGLFVYCDYYRFEDNNLADKKVIRLPDNIILDKGNHIGACFLYSREIKDTIGDYDTDTFLAEDYDYWIRISKKFPMLHLNELLYYYRVHEKSLYVSKFYKVKIVDTLVRLKNDISDIKQATNAFIDLIVQKKKLNRFMARIEYSRKVKNILKGFKQKRIKSADAKLQLEEILGEL